MQFEYFPMGGDGGTLLAVDWSSAIKEAQIRMEQDGAAWAGLIGEAYDPEAGDPVFAGSIQIVDFSRPAAEDGD